MALIKNDPWRREKPYSLGSMIRFMRERFPDDIQKIEQGHLDEAAAELKEAERLRS